MAEIHVGKDYILKTVNDALSIINDNDTIYLHKGIYHEKIKLTKSITIIGEEGTIITYDDYAKKIHSDGKEYNTFRTYTFLILANNVNLYNLTIENSSGEGHIVGQAVALGTIGNNIFIDNCTLKAHQDTLFIGPLPKDLITRYQDFLPQDELIYPMKHTVYINDSHIIGDVDFIFGAGTAIIKNSEITSLKKNGFVCAPATEYDDNEGFTFDNCYFTYINKEIDYHSFLARPWRDYGKATFINCKYQNHINDLGFDKWNDSNRDKTARFQEINCSYFDNHSYTRVYFMRN